VPHGYADPELIAQDVRAGGLIAERVERVVLRGRAPSAHVLAEGFGQGTPLRFALERRGSVEELSRAVGDEMTARLGEGPVEGNLGAFVVTAVKPG
jgi:hypothetical protein